MTLSGRVQRLNDDLYLEYSKVLKEKNIKNSDNLYAYVPIVQTVHVLMCKPKGVWFMQHVGSEYALLLT